MQSPHIFSFRRSNDRRIGAEDAQRTLNINQDNEVGYILRYYFTDDFGDA